MLCCSVAATTMTNRSLDSRKNNNNNCIRRSVTFISMSPLVSTHYLLYFITGKLSLLSALSLSIAADQSAGKSHDDYCCRHHSSLSLSLSPSVSLAIRRLVPTVFADL